MYSINGAIFNTKTLNISIQNRGVNYGDGVFETMRVKNKKIQFADNHYNRLSKASKSIAIRIDLGKIKNWVNDIINVANVKNGIIKINVIREDGGLFTPIGNNGDIIIQTRSKEIKNVTNVRTVSIYDKFEKTYSSTSPYKTINCIEYVKAGLYRQEKQVDDLILINQKKEVVECLYSNVIWIKDDKWFTPSIETGCIKGIMLQHIDTLLNQKKINIDYGSYTIENLLNADVVINSNITGIRYINKIETKNFNSNHFIIDELQNLLK